MSRTTTALALIVAGCIAFAGISSLPGCYRGPATPEGFAPPPGETPAGGLKINVPVKPEETKPDPKPIGKDSNNDGKIDRKERNSAALAYFQETVITYCRWMIGVVTVASIACLILSFTKWSIMSAAKAATGFAVAVGIMVAQLALLKWGEDLADIAGFATVATAIIALCMLGWYIVAFVKARIAAIRRKEIEEQAKQLAAEGHAREATALLSTVNPAANENRSEVAEIISGLPEMDAKAKAKALAKLKEWGVIV